MPILTPEQCKMARAGTGMGIKELAEAAEVSPNTVVRLEGGENIRPRTLRAIRAALEAAGVEFIDENGGGPGVRLVRAQTTRPSNGAAPHDDDSNDTPGAKTAPPTLEPVRAAFAAPVFAEFGFSR